MESRKPGLMKSENFWGYLFIAPQLAGLLAFTIIPVLAAVYLCFTQWDFIKPPEFVGLQNFQAVFVDDWEVFSKTLFNTFIFIIGVIPLTVFVSLSLALLTNREIAGLNFYKSAFFLPMVTSSVSIAMVWYWLYAPDYGLINTLLGYIGISNGPGWLADPDWARIAVVIMSAWLKMGYYYIIFLAGLKGISKSYYEAAWMDGASPFQQFKNVTLPMLSPVTFFVVVMLMIDTFNMFNEAFVLTRGGPVYATYTLVMYVYNQAFQFFKMGEASVASMVLFITVSLVTFLQFKASRKVVNYDV